MVRGGGAYVREPGGENYDRTRDRPGKGPLRNVSLQKCKSLLSTLRAREGDSRSASFREGRGKKAQVKTQLIRIKILFK